MPTSDRTTLRAALDELVSRLRADLVASPPTGAKPFRAVHLGTPTITDHPRPFLAIEIAGARPIGVVDGDRILEVAITSRIAADVSDADPYGTVLDEIGAIEDVLDGWLGGGILDGAEGFDDRAWTFQDAAVRGGPRVVTATAKQTLIVKIQRNQNRNPA